MKVYDIANDLAQELRNTEEYIKFKEIKEQIKNEKILEKMLNDFENARYEAQVATMKGEEPSKEIVQNMQEKYLQLISNEMTNEYLERELKFNTMLTNINNIWINAVGDMIKN